MANQLEVLVYQIDGNPLPEPTVLSFLTSDIFIKESTISGTPEIQSALVYYSNASNLLQNQTFYVSETVDNLREAANANEITQIQATVLEIDGTPQIPLGVQYSFPATGISIWETIDGLMQVNSTIQFKNKKYGVSESEATLIAAANAIADNPNNPCYLEIASNGAFPYTTLADYNTNTSHTTPFTALVPIGLNIQRLYGGSGVVLDLIFQNNIDVTSINDGCGVVTGFSIDAFDGCTSLVYVNFPSVTNITNAAFRNCPSLSVALFPKAVTVGDYVFANGNFLTDISFPLVTTIGANVFEDLDHLKTVYLPKLTFVPANTFSNSGGLTTVDVSSATFIDDGAFQNCNNLISVLATSAQGVGNNCFDNCTSLTAISLPQVEQIFNSCFYGCTALVTVNAPKVTEIRFQAFSLCTNLTTIIAPKVTFIGEGAFSSCYLLNNINFPVVEILQVSAFAACYALTSVNFPLATNIGNSTFDNCTALASINLSAVTSLGIDSGNNSVFNLISGLTITLTVPVAMKTINSGSPDGDIVYLDSNNTLTVNYI